MACADGTSSRRAGAVTYGHVVGLRPLDFLGCGPSERATDFLFVLSKTTKEGFFAFATRQNDKTSYEDRTSEGI